MLADFLLYIKSKNPRSPEFQRVLLSLLILAANTLLASGGLDGPGDLDMLRNSIIMIRSSARYASIKPLLIAKDFVESIRLL